MTMIAPVGAGYGEGEPCSPKHQAHYKHRADHEVPMLIRFIWKCDAEKDWS
jgi:hypothetical protein